MIMQFVKNIVGASSTKMVLVVRTDLKMGRGKIAAQCSHAAVSLYSSSIKSQSALLKQWLNAGQPKIVLKVDTDCENTMRKLFDDAQRIGLNACLVRDAGRTQVESGCVTVLGIGPGAASNIDQLTNTLKLL